MVRLKAEVDQGAAIRPFVSIPYGTIKSLIADVRTAVNLSFNSIWYD